MSHLEVTRFPGWETVAESEEAALELFHKLAESPPGPAAPKRELVKYEYADGTSATKIKTTYWGDPVFVYHEAHLDDAAWVHEILHQTGLPDKPLK